MATIISLDKYLTNCTIETIKSTLFKDSQCDRMYATLITNLVKMINIDIKCGDILQLEPTKNVDDLSVNPIYNRLIWTGVEAVSINYDETDIGSIPLLADFSVPQKFGTDHWNQVIDRCYFPFNSSDFSNEIVQNHKECHQIKHHSDDGTKLPEGVNRYQFTQSSFIFKESVYTLYYVWISLRLMSFEERHKLFLDQLYRDPILPFQSVMAALEENYIVDKDAENDAFGMVHIFVH
jgi:hypothetical protein